MTSSILNLCARTEGHPDQRRLLAAACAEYRGWDDLLQDAEKQGMGPLLYRHLVDLGCNLPDSFVRGLRFLRLRHQQANTLIMQCLRGMQELLEAEGMPCLVLKGAALCNTLYPETGLRPMRDIDLLLAKEDVLHAHDFLQQNGFYASTAVVPDDHFHLTPLFQSVGGLQVCVELHHNLFPDCPPYYKKLPFVDLHRTALPFDVNGVTCYTLATEEMLWHLYQHGFHAPLTYEPYKLISVADIVSLVEEKVEEIDWQKIESLYPQLLHGLPLFHYITPWSEQVRQRILIKRKIAPHRVGERFNGWPRLRLSEQKERGFLEIMRHTFFPGQWWLMIYYTPKGRFSYWWCKFVSHPKQVFWWIKLYWAIFLKANVPADTVRDSEKKWAGFSAIKNVKIVFIAMYRKFH